MRFGQFLNKNCVLSVSCLGFSSVLTLLAFFGNWCWQWWK